MYKKKTIPFKKINNSKRLIFLQSIKQRLESHIAQREEPESKKSSTLSKLSKKEKKKQKESKKLGKSKKLDADKVEYRYLYFYYKHIN